jgi:hypothetical protein
MLGSRFFLTLFIGFVEIEFSMHKSLLGDPQVLWKSVFLKTGDQNNSKG